MYFLPVAPGLGTLGMVGGGSILQNRFLTNCLLFRNTKEYCYN